MRVQNKIDSGLRWTEKERTRAPLLRTVAVLLADPAEVVDVAILLLQVVLDPVVQARDLIVLLLPYLHVPGTYMNRLRKKRYHMHVTYHASDATYVAMHAIRS